MDVRTCPRCGKSVPAFAPFCRRCGVSMAASARPHTPSPAAPEASHWASTVAATAMAMLAMVLTLFALSSWRRTCRGYGPPPAPYFVPTESVPSERTDAATGMGELQSLGAVRIERSADDGKGATVVPTQPGPRIARLAGSFAGAGHKVTIVGVGLEGATAVYFVVGDGRCCEARFRAWDDGRLVAVVPDLGPRPRSASVVVSTADGTTAPAMFHYTGR